MGRQTTARQPDTQRRVLRPRKRNLDIAKSTTIKRRNARLLKHKLSDSPTTTTDHDYGIYTPEFQEIELWEDKYFKIKVPGTVKIRQKVVGLMKQSGAKLPKSILEKLLNPHLRRYDNELRAKGLEFRKHLLELWKMEDVWTFPVDNSFAASFFTQIEQICRMVSASHLCNRCTSICLDIPMAPCGYSRSMRSCGLCKILAQRKLNASDEAEMLKHDHRPLFRLCAAPGWSARHLRS